MSRAPLVITLVLAGLLAGCASDPADPDTGSASASATGDGKADDTSRTPTLTFGADWSEALEGALVPGAKLTIRYDLDRAQECRGSTGGSDVWGVTGFASVDGAEAETFAVTELRDGVTTALDATIEIPAGDDLAVWFQTSNRWGCVAYDSDYGADYHFAIDSDEPARPVLVELAADGSVSQSAAIRGGDEVVVRYALDRTTTCRGTSGGRPQWSITGFFMVDDDEPTPFEVSRVEGSDRVSVDATIRPRDGHELAMWFQNTNRWGCVAWDSRYGANYVFDLTD